MRRRRSRCGAYHDPRDFREVVINAGRELSCEEFKAGAEIRMARCDALPRPYATLCNELNLHAGDVAALAQHGMSVEEVRRKAEQKMMGNRQ